MIKDLIEGKSRIESADIKSVEICKTDHVGVFTSKEHNLDVEILSVAKISGGIEMMVRASRGGIPLGFGANGTIETERFRIFNPPIMVPDGTMTDQEYTLSSGKIVVAKKPNVTEDASAALKQVLAYIVSLNGKEGTNIIPGSVGNTVDTFFPSMDEQTSRQSVIQTWANIRIGNGTGFDDSSAASFIVVEPHSTSNNYITYAFLCFVFDTSAIPDGNTISAATIGFVATTGQKYTNEGDLNINFSQASTSSSATGASADYQNTVATYATAFTTDFTIGSITADNTTYNTKTLNASGIASISKTGSSKFAMRFSIDIAASGTPTWAFGTGDGSGFQCKMSESAGTSIDPVLTVTHAASGPANVKTWDGVTQSTGIKTYGALALASVKTVNGVT